MTGTQIAILLLSLACILNAINCQLLKRQNQHLLDLIDAAYDEIGDLLKDNKFFCSELKTFANTLSVLLDSIKKG